MLITLKKRIKHAYILAEFHAISSSVFKINPSGNNKKLFYPGCSLSGTSPDLVLKIYEHIREKDENVGLWVDCCGMPVSKFVSKKRALPIDKNIINTVRKKGIEEIIIACGNCFVRFTHILKDNPNIKITFLYDMLAKVDWQINDNKNYLIYTPCPGRINKDLHNAFLRLLKASNIQAESMKFILSCCLIKTERARSMRKTLHGSYVITYCAHCAREFQKDFKCSHILQILYDDKNIWPDYSVADKLLNIFRLKKLYKKENYAN